MPNTGIIVKSLADSYTVDVGGKPFVCKARGAFRYKGLTPYVGDMVEFESDSQNSGVITKILERRNLLARPPVANIDRLYIVVAADSPKPNTALIDRVAVIAQENNIEPRFVFNKTDLADITELEAIYRAAGYRTFCVSCNLKTGIEALRNDLNEGINAFTGNTGVGKSSILNLLDPRFMIKTGIVSEKLGRGKHTTRHTEMYKLNDGGYVIDTPGFSSFDPEESHGIYKENIQFDFKEFEPYIGKCRFTSCSHTGEKGCAIGVAVETGDISVSRYENYKAIYEEAASVEEWQKNKK